MRENYFYASIHFYTNKYSSAIREKYELESHINALKGYGLDTSGLGTNAHTWYLSSFSPVQTFLSIFKAGLLWDSGYMPPNSAAIPQVSAENVIALPFFLTIDGEKTILLQNNSTLLYAKDQWTDVSAKYNMPMLLYYHCDFAYESTSKQLSQIRKAGDFQKKNNYGFVTEKQLMYGIAAAYNLSLKVANSIDASEGKLDITIKPEAISNDFPLYDKNYQNSVGARIDFAEAYNVNRISTDADVWYRNGNSLYTSLNRNIRIYESGKKQVETHIENVNIAADINKTDEGVNINFLDNGMMQAVVCGDAVTDSNGWNVIKRGNKTVFTKFGHAAALNVGYKTHNFLWISTFLAAVLISLVIKFLNTKMGSAHTQQRNLLAAAAKLCHK